MLPVIKPNNINVIKTEQNGSIVAAQTKIFFGNAISYYNRKAYSSLITCYRDS